MLLLFEKINHIMNIVKLTIEFYIFDNINSSTNNIT